MELLVYSDSGTLLFREAGSSGDIIIGSSEKLFVCLDVIVLKISTKLR